MRRNRSPGQQWEQALSAAPGVVLDFQSPMPLPVLVHWLAGEDAGLTAQTRRLALYVQGTDWPCAGGTRAPGTISAPAPRG